MVIRNSSFIYMILEQDYNDKYIQFSRSNKFFFLVNVLVYGIFYSIFDSFSQILETKNREQLFLKVLLTYNF